MTPEQETAADKEYRRELDTVLQRVKAAPPSPERSLCIIELQEAKAAPPSPERSLCIIELQEANLWLGMDLKL